MNFVVAIVLTPVFDGLRVPRTQGGTTAADYDESGLDAAPLPAH